MQVFFARHFIFISNHIINQRTGAEYSDREGKSARLSNFFAFMIKPTLKWQK